MRLLIGEYMHNFLAQVLMLTGLPGFLLVFCFAILLAVKMIRFIFAVHPNATVEAKLLLCHWRGYLSMVCLKRLFLPLQQTMEHQQISGNSISFLLRESF